MRDVSEVINVILAILTPFIYGLVMAYLLCPIYNFTVRSIYALTKRVNVNIPRPLTVSKAVASLVSIIVLLVVITGILWMIIPGLVESIANIIQLLPDSMDSLRSWLDVKLVGWPEAQAILNGWINNFTENAIAFVTERLLPEYSSIAAGISEGVMGVFNVVKNFFLGIIICVYFLNSKENFAAQMKKIIMAVFSRKAADEIVQGAHFTNRTFGGFINGQIIDSFIIGLICFIVMTLFGWEYTLLISCIIGITNIIPFFGPFIGAIPSALLLLMVDTRQCIYFVIFIIILQQFDGNILIPKIQGSSTGLASFWVLFAVLVGGGLFGFIGMVIGIPMFAVIYAYVSRAINNRLEKRGLATDLAEYKVDNYTVRRKTERKRPLKMRKRREKR
ncbi:MAG TPA: AI-2E family transporter [Candidatus Copromorpha excrementipullorum]|uniref:AI-2E family transporter n=1 Tax=Candidatus Allocopromorpha excrementipullorum TaxID=2840743 RepID=A0A9D1N803_9FIRM|nr:AI-2E family transporter [Candidatus Copromorpha excrementipullorum]